MKLDQTPRWCTLTNIFERVSITMYSLSCKRLFTDVHPAGRDCHKITFTHLEVCICDRHRKRDPQGLNTKIPLCTFLYTIACLLFTCQVSSW